MLDGKVAVSRKGCREIISCMIMFVNSDYVELLCTAPSAEFALLLIDPPHPHKPPLMDIFEVQL